jgi:CMP-N,N'-diacetyllegionaminic acid synthase
MYKGRSIIALIPARAGSKGLPGKNIKQLLGKPLIAWSIGHAKKSKYVDKVIVSTDSRDIAKIALKYGAETPFIRPKTLATDKAKGIDVVTHAINRLEADGEKIDLLVLLQPTSPLRAPEDVDEAVELLFRKKARAVVSVCETEHHPYWCNTLPKNRSMKDFMRKAASNTNRQELPVFYRLNGAIYIATRDYIVKNNGFIGRDAYAYVMEAERSIDIDNELDLVFAEAVLKRNAGNKKP